MQSQMQAFSISLPISEFGFKEAKAPPFVRKAGRKFLRAGGVCSNPEAVGRTENWLNGQAFTNSSTQYPLRLSDRRPRGDGKRFFAVSSGIRQFDAGVGHEERTRPRVRRLTPRQPRPCAPPRVENRRGRFPNLRAVAFHKQKCRNGDAARFSAGH